MLVLNHPHSAVAEVPPAEKKERTRRRTPASRRGGGGGEKKAKKGKKKNDARKGFEFVLSDGTGRPAADARALIRSHVMRGKNTARRSMPRVPLAEAAAAADAATSAGTALGAKERGSDSTAAESSGVTEGKGGGEEGEGGGSSALWGTWMAPAGDSEDISGSGMLVFASGTPKQRQRQQCQRQRQRRWWEQSPVAAPSDLELCQFAGTLDGNSQPLLWQFFTSLKESMYPMELCFHFDNAKTVWYQWLSVDAAYFNSVLFTVSAFNDVFRSRHGRDSGGNGYILLDDGIGHFSSSSSSSSSRARRADAATSLFAPRTRAYLSRTMAQLQERLYDAGRQCDDVTAAVVVTLAMTADVAGDEEACRAHVGGLMRIVEARGGLAAFDGNKQLQMKLLRIDLAWAMKHGTRPRFADRGLALDWRPRFRAVLARESPVAPDAALPGAAARLCARVAPELAGAYADMHAFASVAGRLFRGREKLRPELYQDMMVSVQYRLLLLGGGEERHRRGSGGGGRSEMAGEGGEEGGGGGGGVVEECFRLGLLAFQASVFVTNLGARVRYDAVAEGMRGALQALRPADEAETSLKLWALLVGAVVVFGPPAEGRGREKHENKEGVEGEGGDGEEEEEEEEEGLWLAGALGEVAALMSWEEVERRLRDVLWIDVLLGERGRKVFERAAAAAAGLRG